MEGYPKNNVTLGKDHGCACGENCSCGSSCTCGASDFKDAEIYSYSFPKHIPSEFVDMWEKEREERISAGVNPLLYAKMFRVQTQLMHTRFPLSMWYDARAEGLNIKGATRGFTDNFSEKVSGLRSSFSTAALNFVEAVKEKEAVFESKIKPIWNNFDSKSQEFAVATNQKVENWRESTNALAHDTEMKVESLKESAKSTFEDVSDRTTGAMDSMKAKFSVGDLSTKAAEEVERNRRMDEKIDPMVAARLGPVQRELLDSMKAN